MRVLHVVPSISLKYGGPSNVPGLVRALIRHGVQATLATTNIDPDGRLDVPVNEPLVRDGVPYVFHHAWPVGGRYALAPSMVSAVRQIARTCDLVHIHWLYNFPCIAAARAAIASSVPFVVQPRGSLDPHMLKKSTRLKRLYLETIGRPLLTRAAAVVFTAEQEREVAVYPRRRPEWVIPNALDWSTYERLPARGMFRANFPAIDGPFLLFLGRLSRQKGLDLLLRAFEPISRARPDLWLVLAGPDHEGYESHVRELARQLGVERRVVFPGMLAGEAKLAAFVDADLFVLPSYSENFGGAIIEALACGLPVLISDQVNIHRELAGAGVAHVVTCSVDSVATGIETMLADRACRERIAALGPLVVRTRYTWDAVAPMILAKYREVIAIHPTTQPIAASGTL
jgi:glycosyltransferase involved in cell wall biosynthesis